MRTESGPWLGDVHKHTDGQTQYVKWVCVHHDAVLRLLRSDGKHWPETVLNVNTVLCNQQTGDDVTSQFVTGTAHRSHECTVTAAQRGTLKERSRRPLKHWLDNTWLGENHILKRPLITPCVPDHISYIFSMWGLKASIKFNSNFM